MSKYNPEQSKKWYEANRERLLPIRRAYNQKWRESEHGKELDKQRNASPERKAARKAYKHSPNGLAYERKRRARPETKVKYENWRLMARYGITVEEYEALYDKQGGKCAICGREDIHALHVDHHHTTGRVRGLLCGSCNRGIGMFGDNKELLLKAITYLDS